MPDVEAQLRQYFDSTVERIDADDVLAGARVTTQLQRWNVRARHPVRVAAAAAVMMTIAIGAVVIGAWALGRTQNRIAEVGPTPTAAQPFETAVWTIALIAAGALIAGAIALTIRKRKGGSMETLERQEPEAQSEHLSKSNRVLIIALVVALLALAGLGAWILFDRVIDTGIEADINALLDEYHANSEAGDWEANVALFAASGVFIDGEGDIAQRDEYAAYYETIEANYGEFKVERLGDPVIIEDPDRNRYFVSVPSQFGAGEDPSYKGFSTFVLAEISDGELTIINHQWSPHSLHR